MINLARAPFKSEQELKKIAEIISEGTEGSSGARIQFICQEALRIAMRRTGYKEPAAPALDEVMRALREDAASNV